MAEGTTSRSRNNDNAIRRSDHIFLSVVEENLGRGLSIPTIDEGAACDFQVTYFASFVRTVQTNNSNINDHGGPFPV